LETINQQSEWSTGDDLSQGVTLLEVDSPALAWLLRGRSLEITSALEPQDDPSIVVSTPIESINLPLAYRGQDFIWQRKPNWEIVGLYEWIKWSVFRDLPYDTESVIVWVRNDLFLDTNPSLP